MLRALVIFLLFVLALAGAVWLIGESSCHQPPKEQGESAQAEQSKKYDCSTTYATFKVGLFETWSFVHEHHDEVIAVGTVFIAIFTIILGIFTVSLAGSTQELVRETRETGERQLRAYISLIPRDIINWTNLPQRVGVKMDLKNHGRTPGFEILYNFSMLVLDRPLPAVFVWPPTDLHYDQNNTVFPDEVLFVRFFLNRDLTGAERSAIEAGTKRFHVRGIMHYRDAFREPRTTKFSFSFGGPDFARVMQGQGGQWNWEHGPTHNDAT